MFSATVDRWYIFLFQTINIRVKTVGYLTFLFQVWKNVIKNNRQVLYFIFNCVHKQQLNWKEASYSIDASKANPHTEKHFSLSSGTRQHIPCQEVLKKPPTDRPGICRTPQDGLAAMVALSQKLDFKILEVFSNQWFYDSVMYRNSLLYFSSMGELTCLIDRRGSFPRGVLASASLW